MTLENPCRQILCKLLDFLAFCDFRDSLYMCAGEFFRRTLFFLGNMGNIGNRRSITLIILCFVASDLFPAGRVASGTRLRRDTGLFPVGESRYF
jgi:hypothetical protein